MNNLTDMPDNTETFGCSDPNCCDCSRSITITDLETNSLKGIVVFYFEVEGYISAAKAETFRNNQADKLRPLLDKLHNQGYETLIIPRRNQPSSVEVLPLK